MADFDIERCTGREVLAVVLESHERELHALHFVERLPATTTATLAKTGAVVAGERLRFNCRCRSFAVFTDEAIRQDFGFNIETVYERLSKMGYVR